LLLGGARFFASLRMTKRKGLAMTHKSSFEISNDKAQMPNKVQRSNDQNSRR